jgi:hypothetical protein
MFFTTKGTKITKGRDISSEPLCSLRPFDLTQDMLCGSVSDSQSSFLNDLNGLNDWNDWNTFFLRGTVSVYSLSAEYRKGIGGRCVWLTANEIQNSSLSSISLKEKMFCGLRR